MTAQHQAGIANLNQSNELNPCRYVPLIQSDTITRQPIHQWRHKLVAELENHLSTGTEVVANIMNQLALLEAYIGNNTAAFNYCRWQIDYWRNLADCQSDNGVLINVIQPWVNIFRLERWQCNHEIALAMYEQISPEKRHLETDLQHRFSVPLTVADILTLPNADVVQGVVEAVYWLESSHLLLVAKDNSALMQRLQQGLAGNMASATKMRLLELWFKALNDKGEYARGLSALHRMCLTESAYSLEFSLLELVLLFNIDADELPKSITVIFDRVMAKNDWEKGPRHLYLLAKISVLFSQIGTQEQYHQLLQLQLNVANSLNDEVIAFEAKSSMADRGWFSSGQLREEFLHSDYQVIRRRLGLEKKSYPEADELSLALEKLSRLEFDGAQQHLQELQKLSTV